MKKTAGLESSVVVFVIAAVFMLKWRVTYHMVDALSTYDGRGGVTEKRQFIWVPKKRKLIYLSREKLRRKMMSKVEQE